MKITSIYARFNELTHRGQLILQLKFNKNYEELEDAERFEIFKVNLKKIEEHNARYEKVMKFK